MVVVALVLVVFGLSTGEFVVAGILPDLARDLSVSVPSAGLAVTAYALGMIVGGPVVTVLTARVARRPLALGLVTVSALANAASALAPGYPTLLLARFVAGLVVATFFAVAVATAVALARPGAEASAIARVALGLNLGIVLGTPIGTLLGHQLSWRATFGAVAAFVAVALVLLARAMPALPAAATGPVWTELRVFGRRDLQLAIALTAAGSIGAVTVFTYIAPLLTRVSGFAAGAVPLLLLGYGAGAVLGTVAGGRLADRARLPAVTGLLAALAAVLALCWLAASVPVAAVILLVALGALAFAVIPGMQAQVMASASGAATLAVAVNAAGFQLAAAVAGWLGGQVVDSRFGARSVYLVGALLTVGGLVVALAMGRKPHRGSGATPIGTTPDRS